MAEVISALFVILIALLWIILIVIGIVGLIGLVIYLTVFPYWLAKKYPITNNFTMDCFISYAATWLFSIIGNGVYLCVSFLKNGDGANGDKVNVKI